MDVNLLTRQLVCTGMSRACRVGMSQLTVCGYVRRVLWAMKKGQVFGYSPARDGVDFCQYRLSNRRGMLFYHADVS